MNEDDPFNDHAIFDEPLPDERPTTMIAYYTFPRTGKGTDDEPYGPSVPAGFTSWSVVEERKDDFLVEVEAPDAYHAARTGKVAEVVTTYETVQVPVTTKLVDRRAGKLNAELTSVDALKTAPPKQGGATRG